MEKPLPQNSMFLLLANYFGFDRNALLTRVFCFGQWICYSTLEKVVLVPFAWFERIQTIDWRGCEPMELVAWADEGRTGA